MQVDFLREGFKEFALKLSEYLIEDHPETSFYGFGSVFQEFKGAARCSCNIADLVFADKFHPSLLAQKGRAGRS